ncbi:rpl7 (chloroplast) [Auxenochlorella protothecoides x Auxenochlorella symbiontica]|uniref:Large ribosomal subunit protein bL12c n=1 Tax=Auxenochlorella protothecoides TaxID=3075 RepID=A0A023HHZ9_AUXPR|nr:ribosomal protein L12 [Auxenochlorella protothecoides]AGL10911.1 ribosomal protein L12 [Auxenochlorella protothecoides]AGN72456.1 50S ribosomal protein L12 [Auxenochlorella protothecoides]ARU77476.1 ribosomal protein L12 [Auxenochlorella protothecoides]
MSTITIEILEKLKTITLLEASQLVSQIEDAFGVDASIQTTSGTSAASTEITKQEEVIEEKTTFDIILEEVPSDKRVPILKVIRNLTSLDLKQAKEAITDLPKTILQGASKEESETAKQQLEAAGGKIKVS